MTNQEQSPYITLSGESRAFSLNLRELWQFRYLVFYLGMRNVAIRYKQTFLGFVWAIIQPLSTVAVYTLVFGNLTNFAEGDIPYPIFTFVALLPFLYFSKSSQTTASSLVQNTNLISKVYFPRLIIPLSTMIAPLLDSAITFGLLLVLMIISGVQISANIIFLPLWLLLLILFSLGIGIWLSSFSVRYRDAMYVLPFVIQMLQFLSPVIYATDVVPEEWLLVYSLNPLTTIIEGFRWSILGTDITISSVSILFSSVICLVILITGIAYFSYVEQDFADII